MSPWAGCQWPDLFSGPPRRRGASAPFLRVLAPTVGRLLGSTSYTPPGAAVAWPLPDRIGTRLPAGAPLRAGAWAAGVRF